MEDREAELSEHLTELRTRLIRAIVYIGVGAVVAWFFYDRLYSVLTEPVKLVLESGNTRFMITRITEGFMIRCQISIIAGVILALPLITAEVWGFVSPALTKQERRSIKWIVPFCIILFACGVATAYLIMPAAMKFFVKYVPANTEFRPTVADNIVFIVRMLLAFGLVFELPIILLFLGKLGIVSSQTLKSGWRYAVVGIAVLAAIATPSGDLFSMMAMAVPVTLLYLISILLVKIVERKA